MAMAELLAQTYSDIAPADQKAVRQPHDTVIAEVVGLILPNKKQ
jgi:hypothetical protein